MKHEFWNQKNQTGSKQRFRGQPWKRAAKSSALLAVILIGLGSIIATGGGGGGGGSGSSGYLVPTEISAVPTSLNAAAALSNLSLRAKLNSLARSATDPGTDYTLASTKKYVEEHALEQFEIIEQVLNAISQTHYADATNIGAGPYKAMVAWEDEENGRNIKQLEPWVVDSQEIAEFGQNVLRVRAWIEEQDEEGTELVKAEFKIYSPATKKADGSYQNYGVWTLNVKFDDTGEDYFAASASIGNNGESIVKIHERFPEGMPGSPVVLLGEMKAIMNRSATAGYGQVYYPNWEALWGPEADPNPTELPHKSAKYAYSEDYLAVKDGDADTVYKDRNTVYEMTHRYGVYNADTGQDVMKIKSFGFPIRYTIGDITKHAYYGAWQGRHEIWTQGGNDTIPAGTEVTREDTPPDQPAETYTVGETFSGTLAKRTYVNADISDIKNIPVEIWINNDYNLIYDSGVWKYCTQMDWTTFPATCAVALKVFADEIGFESLIVGANDDRKCVGINGWDNDAMQPVSYVYEAASGENSGAGFYKATQGDDGRATVIIPREKLTPSEGDSLFVWIGGSIFVMYNGTGWVEKEVVGFDTMTWTPEFSETGDKDYILPEGKELYVNMQGANYIVTRTGADYTTNLELQTAANPSNATAVVPANTEFKDQWNPDGSSTYEFVTDSGSANYLMLVYKTIGDNDKDSQGNAETGVSVGGVVQKDLWGLEAFVGGVTQDTMYNWEYKSENENWGSVTYLKDADGNYKLLDDPMRFDSMEVTNAGGEPKTIALQYDGWMMGLPDMHQELGKNNWVMTDDIANKIINLAAGTEVTESATDTVYLLKPLEVSQFLKLVTNTAGLTLPDITQADSVDLSTVPDFVEHGMGDMPTDTIVKYSEGEPVE